MFRIRSARFASCKVIPSALSSTPWPRPSFKVSKVSLNRWSSQQIISISVIVWICKQGLAISQSKYRNQFSLASTQGAVVSDEPPAHQPQSACREQTRRSPQSHLLSKQSADIIRLQPSQIYGNLKTVKLVHDISSISLWKTDERSVYLSHGYLGTGYANTTTNWRCEKSKTASSRDHAKICSGSNTTHNANNPYFNGPKSYSTIFQSSRSNIWPWSATIASA